MTALNGPSLCFQYPFSIDKDGKGKKCDVVGNDENSSKPNKRHPHWSQILLCIGVARTFLRRMLSPFVQKKRIQKHMHNHKGVGCLRNKVRKVFPPE